MIVNSFFMIINWKLGNFIKKSQRIRPKEKGYVIQQATI
jgi:hypothetical protein